MKFVSDSVILSFIISVIWGTTNVVIKRTTRKITKIQAKNWFDRIVNELKYLLTNWQYLLPFFVNQAGSVLFYLLIVFSELSLVVPVTNSLTFLVTGVCSVYCGENVPSLRKFHSFELSVI